MTKGRATPASDSTAPRKRLSPEARRGQIVTAATELFAEKGFDASTRDLAKLAGITQPLLYRYFPDKDGLIEAVYARVFLDRWNPEWDATLEDRGQPVRARFAAFYDAYTDSIFDPVWLRISSFAALREARINRWYNHVVEELILKRLVRETRVERGGEDRIRVTRAELEPAWLLHGGLLNYGMRRHILGLPVLDDKPRVIRGAIDQFLAGFGAEGGGS
ncbi:TetR/AcrR family transcriptional regulator (plasmid) [Salipiger sp. H15]|uniref:TetR/AcrR family transcriptional regulator n=1 Tax=Alloyangia sp. H15 TaxID=3029062 RepID=A0AAU8AQL4_9RHOB